MCVQRETRSPLSGANTGTNWRSQVFFEAGCKFRLLADRVVNHCDDILISSWCDWEWSNEVNSNL